MKLEGGLTSEALRNAADTLGDAFEPPGAKIANKRFGLSREMSRKQLISRLSV